MNLEDIVKEVITISEEVGTFLLSQDLQPEDVEHKSLNSLVSFVDKQAESMFVESLSKLVPEAGFIAEEGTGERKKGLNWIIDPLDGTKEFVKRNGEFTVNIALIHNGNPIMGVIYVPV